MIAHGASRGWQCIQREKPRQGERIVAYDASDAPSNAGNSFAPTGAQDVVDDSATPGWRPGLPTFVPAGLPNRWASPDHDAER